MEQRKPFNYATFIDELKGLVILGHDLSLSWQWGIAVAFVFGAVATFSLGLTLGGTKAGRAVTDWFQPAKLSRARDRFT